ncbi:L-threonylcarbamoyladenylate synthase [Gellertiella hungarica]|uniref:Threonylcarbamoyl-AMP synthase n=1 Tax=Gellertiella hungarica TaxID=1572859 RepID=A0A7W6NJG8_9HYPH|nr:L-threonylcarbamoyladenylate synthase [Gellertiella hungarica]MBB4064385.1 L-threonylcarbamoyladenylate synthase [Gellertiella hungarica]
MTARLISIAEAPREALEAAIAELAAGRPIAMPTETVYGLAADATNPAAITRIYETKGRPRFNPLIAHVADLGMARIHARFDPLSEKLAHAFWPGPLTLILPLRPDSGIHDLATSGLDTVGLRVPQGFAGEIIRAFGKPLAAPSANTSGGISPTSATHVMEDLGEKIGLVLDGGASDVGVESTIVKVEADGRLRLLRPGGIPAEEIERVAGKPLERPEKAGAAIEAPGMLASHYAPDAAMRLQAEAPLEGEAYLAFGPRPVPDREKAVFFDNLSPAGNLAEAAARLFAAMKAADRSGATMIAVAPIPGHGLGEAINDRLERAAAPRA